MNPPVIRPLAAGDAPALHAAVRASIASLSRWLPWCRAGYSLADAEARVAASLAGWRDGSEYPFGLFARGDGDGGDEGGGERLLGCAGLNRFDRAARSANLGYWIGEAHRGQGLATRAAAHAAAFGFRELGLARIEIAVSPDNAASLGVAARLGARREGIAPGRIEFEGHRADALLFGLYPGDQA